MRTLRISVFVSLALVLLSVSADAQRTRRRTPPAPKVVASTNVSNPADLKMGADKVSIQIKNVTKFIYALGGIATGIETIDKDTRANKAAKDANVKNKQEVMQAIRNLRAGIVALEIEFRTKTALKKFLPQIQGISDLLAQCENLGAAGRFSESGRPLLLTVEKLSDTLAAM